MRFIRKKNISTDSNMYCNVSTIFTIPILAFLFIFEESSSGLRTSSHATSFS